MTRLKDGDRCPASNRHAMIRSDVGCISCKHKEKLIANQHVLYVDCRYKECKPKQKAQ